MTEAEIQDRLARLTGLRDAIGQAIVGQAEVVEEAPGPDQASPVGGQSAANPQPVGLDQRHLARPRIIDGAVGFHEGALGVAGIEGWQFERPVRPVGGE